MFKGRDAMPSTMYKVVTITCIYNNVACYVVDLAPFDAFTCCEALTHKGNSRVTRTTYHLEHFPLLLRNLVTCTRKGNPGIVGINGIVLGEMGPEIEENEVTMSNRAEECAGWHVMGIAGIGIHGDNWRIRHAQ